MHILIYFISYKKDVVLDLCIRISKIKNILLPESHDDIVEGKHLKLCFFTRTPKN